MCMAVFQMAAIVTAEGCICHVTGVPGYLRPLATRLFVWQLVQDYSKESIKCLPHGPVHSCHHYTYIFINLKLLIRRPLIWNNYCNFYTNSCHFHMKFTDSCPYINKVPWHYLEIKYFIYFFFFFHISLIFVSRELQGFCFYFRLWHFCNPVSRRCCCQKFIVIGIKSSLWTQCRPPAVQCTSNIVQSI